MKTTKFLTAAIIASGLSFTACGDDKKNSEAFENNGYQSEMGMDTEVDSGQNENDTVIMTKQYAMSNGNNISYDTHNDEVVALRDWDTYNTLNYEMDEITANNMVTTKTRIANLNGTIMNLGKTIPAWLKTEEVMEDVADIQKEYKELLAEKNASEKEYNENLEEVSEQFADLREELTETINEYIEINREAIEEYNEEMKKGKLEAAREEYNEEIKKQDKIADYKENK